MKRLTLLLLPMLLLGAACQYDAPTTRQNYARFQPFGVPTPGPVTTLSGVVIDDTSEPATVVRELLRAMEENRLAVAARDPDRINAARRQIYLLSDPTIVQGTDPQQVEQKLRTALNGWLMQAGYFLDGLDWTTLSADPTIGAVAQVRIRSSGPTTRPAGLAATSAVLRFSLQRVGAYWRLRGLFIELDRPATP